MMKIDQTEDNPTPSFPEIHRGYEWKVWVLLSLVFLVILIMNYPAFKRATLERRAAETLRSIGSAQLAYQGTNSEKRYASFQTLKDDYYIAEGYTLGNLIEGYRISWQNFNVDLKPGEMYCFGGHSFTIVAYPTYTRTPLRTFGITEDQVVRVYNPKNTTNTKNLFKSQADPNVTTWDPIYVPPPKKDPWWLLRF